MLLTKIVGQLGIGHQMEPHQLHGSSLRTPFRKFDRRSLTARRGHVNRQPAPVGARGRRAAGTLGFGKWRPVDFAGCGASLMPAHSRLTGPEPSCDNFRYGGAWKLRFTRLCCPARADAVNGLDMQAAVVMLWMKARRMPHAAVPSKTEEYLVGSGFS
jgi:hypothetical protein